MSAWISLQTRTGPAKVARHEEGGTYQVGGSDVADLNVTYNYWRFFDFDTLHGRQAGETIGELALAIARLGTERDPDYWAKTPGNAGYALSILESWAHQHPEAVWDVS